MANSEKELLCLNAIKSMSIAAKAMQASAQMVAELQKEINEPDLKVVETKMIKRIIITSIAVLMALCALFGASYFIGYFYIEPENVKSESVSLVEARSAFGLLVGSMLYSAVRFTDFIAFTFKQTKKEENL